MQALSKMFFFLCGQVESACALAFCYLMLSTHANGADWLALSHFLSFFCGIFNHFKQHRETR